METSITSYQASTQVKFSDEDSDLAKRQLLQEKRETTFSVDQLPSSQIQFAEMLSEIDLRSIDPETAGELLNQIHSGASIGPIIARLKDLCARDPKNSERKESMIYI